MSFNPQLFLASLRQPGGTGSSGELAASFLGASAAGPTSSTTTDSAQILQRQAQSHATNGPTNSGGGGVSQERPAVSMDNLDQGLVSLLARQQADGAQQRSDNAVASIAHLLRGGVGSSNAVPPPPPPRAAAAVGPSGAASTLQQLLLNNRNSQERPDLPRRTSSAIPVNSNQQQQTVATLHQQRDSFQAQGPPNDSGNLLEHLQHLQSNHNQNRAVAPATTTNPLQVFERAATNSSSNNSGDVASLLADAMQAAERQRKQKELLENLILQQQLGNSSSSSNSSSNSDDDVVALLLQRRRLMQRQQEQLLSNESSNATASNLATVLAMHAASVQNEQRAHPATTTSGQTQDVPNILSTLVLRNQQQPPIPSSANNIDASQQQQQLQREQLQLQLPLAAPVSVTSTPPAGCNMQDSSSCAPQVAQSSSSVHTSVAVASHAPPVPPPSTMAASSSSAAIPGTVAIPEKKRRRGRSGSFPQKIHQMLRDLENQGRQDIASFVRKGDAFCIHRPKEFAKEVMPKYFKMGSYASFQRQLNLYDFTRIGEGPNRGSYFHPLFIKGKPLLSTTMKRKEAKKAPLPSDVMRHIQPPRGINF